MARVFIDGPGAGDLKLWTLIGVPTIGSGDDDFDGTYYIAMTGATGITRILPLANEYYVAFKLKVTSAADNQKLIAFYNNTTLLGKLEVPNTTPLKVYRNTTLIGTGSTTLTTNIVYRIEVRYKPDTTLGIFQVKVNGILEIDYSGDSGTTTQINKITIKESNSNVIRIGDVVIDDAVWPGNTKIQVFVPAGIGSSSQWTPSTGDNYECVNEIPPSETDYVESNTVGHLDLYAASNPAIGSCEIKCVQIQALAVTEGAPTPTSIQLALRSGGSNYFSASQVVPSSSTQLAAIWETDPATDDPWIDGGVNALEIGVKAVA
jgi:hypothetical protein